MFGWDLRRRPVRLYQKCLQRYAALVLCQQCLRVDAENYQVNSLKADPYPT